MTIFSGGKNWDSFIYQLERVGDRFDWSTRKRAERLVDCLSGEALDYVRELHLENDYRRMKRKLGKRFGIKDAPITVRRQLQFIKQDESDSLEAYSQKVMVMVMDGFPGAREKIQEQIAVEHFLKGCIDRRAASVAMDKNPRRIHQAVQYVKDAINNRRVIYGKNPGTTARRVSFDPSTDKDTFDVKAVKNVLKQDNPAVKNFEKDCRQKFQDIESMLKQLMVRSRTPPGFGYRSPTPPRSPQKPEDSVCFRCRKKGHFQKDCPLNSNRNIQASQVEPKPKNSLVSPQTPPSN